MDTVVAAMENWVNISPSRLMPCRHNKGTRSWGHKQFSLGKTHRHRRQHRHKTKPHCCQQLLQQGKFPSSCARQLLFKHVACPNPQPYILTSKTFTTHLERVGQLPLLACRGLDPAEAAGPKPQQVRHQQAVHPAGHITHCDAVEQHLYRGGTQ